MPKPNRIAPPGFGQHVTNRACEGHVLFQRPEEFTAFRTLLLQACVRFNLPLLAFCLMPNHWHIVALPTEEGQLSRALHWLITVHATQMRRNAGTVGKGHIYQGRFRSVLIECDHHLLVAMRYVERNALRANLVARAEEWEWGSLHARLQPDGTVARTLADKAPLPSLDSWLEIVNSPNGAEEEEAFRQSVRRNSPYGSPEFVARMSPRGTPEPDASLASSRVIASP